MRGHYYAGEELPALHCELCGTRKVFEVAQDSFSPETGQPEMIPYCPHDCDPSHEVHSRRLLCVRPTGWLKWVKLSTFHCKRCGKEIPMED